MTSIKVEGVEALNRDLEKMAKKYGAATVKGAVMAGQLVRTDAIKSIQSISHGNEVTRTRLDGTRYSHTASKEGDAPNNDTSGLVKSIQVDTNGKFVFVGTSLKYGPWLEFGTRRMSARPWLFPALENNRAKIRLIFNKEITAITRQGI